MGEDVHGREILEMEGGVGRKKQEENGVALSTAVCIEETVVYEPLLPAKKIRRPHSVLILRGLEGVCLARSILTPSGVGGTEGSEPEGAGESGEYVDSGVRGASYILSGSSIVDERERMEDPIAHVALQEEYSSFHNVVGLLYSISESLSLLQREQRASDCSTASPWVDEPLSLSRSTSTSQAQRAMLPSNITPSA